MDRRERFHGDADPRPTRTLYDELTRVRAALGDRPDIRDHVLPQERIPTQIVREDYQSGEFREFSHDLDPEAYGSADRSLWLMTFPDNTQVFFLAGRTTSKMPGETGEAVIAASDRRALEGVVYEYDGNAAITETVLSSREKNVYTGEYGHPDQLLSHVRRVLGERVDCTTFVRKDQAKKPLIQRIFRRPHNKS